MEVTAVLFRKKSRARLKADAKIKALKRENRDFVRGMMKFTALAVLTLLLMLGMPFVICLNLVYVFGRPVMEAVLASFAVGMFVIPFLFTEPLRRLVSYGESLVAEKEMRDWRKRRKPKPQDKKQEPPEA